jgi:tetratricopeptide (TPR) repeat protein
VGRYSDSLLNLEKAEQLIGPDLEIMQRKAVIYGIKGDIKNGILTANQMKLIAPSEYRGYQIAFKLLLQEKHLEAARKELAKAERYASPSMDYYTDYMTLELEQYRASKDKDHLRSALGIIEKSLQIAEPDITHVIESYINAAEVYLQLEEPEKTIDCLRAAQNPVGAYNNRFEIMVQKFEPTELTEYDIEDMIQEDQEKIAEKYGEYGLEELASQIEPDEDGRRDYLTEFEEEPQESKPVYRLKETDQARDTSENNDRISQLYIGAYTLMKDFDKVIEYARKLQASENVQNTYIGRYTELHALKELGAPDVEEKYQKIIRSFRNAMIKDPTDMTAVTCRIQCYIDIGDYKEAEQMCSLLAKDIREPLLETIKEAQVLAPHLIDDN